MTLSLFYIVLFVCFLHFLGIDVIINLATRLHYRSNSYINSTNI